jgi:hypothetical protein
MILLPIDDAVAVMGLVAAASCDFVVVEGAFEGLGKTDLMTWCV